MYLHNKIHKAMIRCERFYFTRCVCKSVSSQRNYVNYKCSICEVCVILRLLRSSARINLLIVAVST